MPNEHTPGALKAARIIVPSEQRGDSKLIGKVAAIIDRETAVPELLEALKAVHDEILDRPDTFEGELNIEQIEAAIHKATEK